ncbi:MAG: hypothetical protein MJZ37_01115 [Bacilli bacterium]|nr:hypothetical protein [Bacilli bacterium]
MNKEFDIYNPGSWVFASDKTFKYKGKKLIDVTTNKFYTEKFICLFINSYVSQEKIKFNNDKEFEKCVNSILDAFLDNTRTFKCKKKFVISDYATWKNCKNVNENLIFQDKLFLRFEDYQPMKIKEFMDFCNNLFSLFDQRLLTVAERNKTINKFLLKFYENQTDEEVIKKIKLENTRRELIEKEEERKREEEENIKHGIILSEMSGVFVAGQELTFAQHTLFQILKLTKEQQEIVVNTWNTGRSLGLRSYQIKQDMFGKLGNTDYDFIVGMMKAEYLFDEESNFVDYLFDWVTECETEKEVEAIFDYPYFKKHPEIKKSILDDNIYWGMENNKIFRREE